MTNKKMATGSLFTGILVVHWGGVATKESSQTYSAQDNTTLPQFPDSITRKPCSKSR